jgi:hypothetical protein
MSGSASSDSSQLLGAPYLAYTGYELPLLLDGRKKLATLIRRFGGMSQCEVLATLSLVRAGLGTVGPTVFAPYGDRNDSAV